MKTPMRQLKSCRLAAGLILLAVGIASAGTFVSLNGRFLVTYPDDWRQVTFAEVDLVLSMSNARNDTYAYEAVFAPTSSLQFQTGPYVILKVDTVGEMSQKQIDSVVAQLGKSFGGVVRTTSLEKFLTNATDNSPEYVPETQTVAVMSSLSDDDKNPKVSVLAMKFYNRGIANLYFYAPKTQLEQFKPIFKNILASFSTENIDAALPRENVKVANPEKMKNSSDTNSTSGGRLWVVLGVLAIVVAIAFAVSRMRNRQTR